MYAEESRIPRTHLDELFRDILAVKDRPEKDTLLQDHWNEETRIREWIIEVRDADPGSSTGRVDLPPNRRVAYLFAEHLELSPAQILETYRDCTLTEMAEVFRREYGERHKASPSEVDVRFGSMLDCGAGAKRTLGAYCAPEHRCTHWTHSVQRRADSEIHQSVRLGLETIFQEETQPEISMTFIRSTLLRNPVAALARQLHLETQKWKELLQFELQHFVTIPMPKGHTVDGWLRPLADQIRLSCRSGTPIRASLDTRANESEEQTLARWRTQVLGKVKPQFGCHCPETVIFAKLFG